LTLVFVANNIADYATAITSKWISWLHQFDCCEHVIELALIGTAAVRTSVRQVGKKAANKSNVEPENVHEKQLGLVLRLIVIVRVFRVRAQM
jgi:hypothetical protein